MWQAQGRSFLGQGAASAKALGQDNFGLFRELKGKTA